MNDAIKRGLKKLEELGYLKWNEHYNSETAYFFIVNEIEKMSFREMRDFLK